MSPDNVVRPKALWWWIAFGSQALVFVVEAVGHDYLKAVSAGCLALTFLMLATDFTGDGPGRPLWRKIVVFILVAISIGLLVYQIAVGRLLK